MSFGIRIACVGVGANEISVMKSLLVIADNKLNESVVFVDPRSADILFVGAEGENYQNFWLSRKVDFPSVKRFIAVSNVNIVDADRTIRFPLRISHLIEILNEAIPQNGLSGEAPGPMIPLVAGKLFEHIANCSGAQSMRVDCRQLPGIHCGSVLDVDFINNRYRYAGSRQGLLALCTRDIPSPMIEADVQHGFDSVVSGESGRLSQLIWPACTLGSTEHLLAGLPAYGEFSIKKWPELFLAEESGTVNRVLALLARNKASVDRIESLIGALRREVVGVLNACKILGVLEYEQNVSVPIADDRTTQERVGLIAMIKSRLGL